MNIELLRQRKRELYGASIECKPFDHDSLNVALALTLEHKPVTDQSILIRRMELALEEVGNTPFKPFLIAIKELYERTNK